MIAPHRVWPVARGWLVALLVATSAAPAHADDEELAPLQINPLRVDWRSDGPLAAASLVLWSGLGFGKATFAPPACHWCSAPQLDASVRRAVLWSNPAAAATTSNYVMWSIPVGMVVYDVLAARSAGYGEAAFADLLVMTQAVAVTGVLTQVVKYTSGRERPYGAGATLSRNNSNAVASFWSGHTATAFSAAAAGGMVAQLRNYPGWQWVYGLGFAAAAGTGYLRMAGDEHWLTDVVAGAAAGTAIGLVIPWLHRSTSTQLFVTRETVGVSGRF